MNKKELSKLLGILAMLNAISVFAKSSFTWVFVGLYWTIVAFYWSFGKDKSE